MQFVQGRAAAAVLAFVLDVVVDQQRVVQHLDTGGRAHGVLRLGPERLRCRDAQARPHHLAAARRIIGDRIVEMPLGAAAGKIIRHHRPRHRAVLLKHGRNGLDGGDVHGVARSGGRIFSVTAPAGVPSGSASRRP